MSIIDTIVSRIDIVDYIEKYTKLTQYGNDYKGKCPIHGSKEHMPFSVTPSKGIYHCFSCGSAGSVINFVEDMEKISFMAAVEKLAIELNIDIKNDKGYAESKAIIARMERATEQASKHIDKAKEYLTKERGLTEEIIDEFRLGWHDGIVFPIRDHFGRTVACARRQFNKHPKYVNSVNNALYDKSSLLYNLDKARKLIKNEVYLVEGYMDAISGHQMGIPTIAFCANEIYKDHIATIRHVLKRDVTVIYCPDNDSEGHKKLAKVRDSFMTIAPNINVRVMVMPEDCKDMNDLLVKGINPATLPKEHIDEYTLKYLIANCANEEDEFAVAEKFLRSVRSVMIKLKLIKMIAEMWKQDETVLRKAFDAMDEDADDILADVADFDSCVTDLRDTTLSGGHKTGFTKVDNTIRRIRKKQTVVVGAYSYAGKTDFAIELLLNFVMQMMRVVFFSLEMPRGALIERVIAKILEIKVSDVARLIADGDETVLKARDILNKYLIVIDRNNLSMDDIDKRIKLINSRNIMGAPIDAVIVDYFTYIKGVNDPERASVAARQMKAIAKDNNIVFVMLSQLNREGSNYEEPTMRQLRMTGDLEASADIIMLLWRPGLNPRLTPEQMEDLKYQTMIKIDKARDGIFGSTRIEFQYLPDKSRLIEV